MGSTNESGARYGWKQDEITSTISLANTVKLWLSAFEANSPLGRALHCLLTSASMASKSTPSPAITRTT